MAHAQTVLNGGFEANTASFTSFPGYVNTGANPSIDFWTSNNNQSGLNNENGTGNPFADNGTKPEGTTVAFLQVVGSTQTTSISQAVSGFVVGSTYNVEFFVNRRQTGNSTSPTLNVLLDNQAVFSSSAIPIVGGTNPYLFVTSSTFTATSTSSILTFAATNPNGGDTTVLLDGVGINLVTNAAAPEPGTLALLLPVAVGGLSIARRRRK